MQSAAIFQRVESTVLQTYVLVTVSSGIVYSRVTTSGDDGTESKFVHANSNSDPLKLPRARLPVRGASVAKQFGVRASETSGRVFVTNRNYCLAYVLTPLPGSAGYRLPIAGMFLTMSTTGTYPPDGLAVAPGVAINVAQCTGGTLADLGGCDLLGDSGDTNDYPAVRMYAVELEPNSPTNLRVFKVEGIPDCRYILKQIPLTSLPADHPCRLPGVVVNDPKVTDGTQNFPQRQYLNVTPMLPTNVTEVFDASGKKPPGLPKMLIQPRYRAQAINGYTSRRCLASPTRTSASARRSRSNSTSAISTWRDSPSAAALHQTVTPTSRTAALQSVGHRDRGVRAVRERRRAEGNRQEHDEHLRATVPAEHVDTMINKGCYNPTPKAGTRWSMYSYNMELAEDRPVKSSQYGPVTGFEYSKAVKYLGNLLLSLHTELGAAQDKLACANVDYDRQHRSTLTAIRHVLAVPATVDLHVAQVEVDVAQNYMKKCAAAVDYRDELSEQELRRFLHGVQAYKTIVEGLAVIGAERRSGQSRRRTLVAHGRHRARVHRPLQEGVAPGAEHRQRPVPAGNVPEHWSDGTGPQIARHAWLIGMITAHGDADRFKLSC